MQNSVPHPRRETVRFAACAYAATRYKLADVGANCFNRFEAMPSAEIVCSLCQHEIPAAYLRTHQEQETREIIAYTIELIKQANPEWSENDPTCQKCWDHYRGIAAT